MFWKRAAGTSCGWPFNMKVRDVLNVNDLGYDYAAAQAIVPVGGTR
jgi:hypothetical protein